MSFMDMITSVDDEDVKAYLINSGNTDSYLDSLNPVEKVLLEVKARIILKYQSMDNLTRNQQDFLDFLLSVDDEYYRLGLCPSSQKQYDFTASTAKITVFGGAAGSGKSHCGVADLLQHTHDNSYAGVIFRRTTPQLKGVGGMWQKANELYGDVLGYMQRLDQANSKVKGYVPMVPKGYRKLQTQTQEMKITMPSDALIQFRHMEHIKDKYNIQGWEICEALVDEATQFELEQVMYIVSRLRNPKWAGVSGMEPHIKMTCNPDADSFLRKWLEDAGFLDKEGYPLYERSGDIVYCGELEGDMVFAQTEEEFKEQYPSLEAMTFTFIPATCEDNPVLMYLQPSYLTNLKNQSRVERARLLHGNWFVREQAAGFFKREWCGKPLSLYELPTAVRKVRSWDKAATLPSEVYPDPDYTVGLHGIKDSTGHIYITDMVRGRWRPSGVQEAIEKAALSDGHETTVTIPVDAGAAGKAEADNCASKIFSLGITCKKKKTHANKVKRFEPVAALAENGMIHVVKADWNEKFFDELEQFTGSQKGHDDIVDALSDLINELAMSREVGLFSLPDLNGLVQTNHFSQR